jgi:hypothetical protein
MLLVLLWARSFLNFYIISLRRYNRMNYEALDEALAYIEYKNSDEVVNEDASLWVLAGVFATLIATLAACMGIGVGVVGKKYREERKRIDEAVKDPKVQAVLKKLVETMQKDIAKYPEFKKYTKFVKNLSYKYKIVNKYSDPEVDKVAIEIPFLQFDMEEIFKVVMGTNMDFYTYDYCMEQPDNCKPAPKFKKYVKEMIKAAKSYISNNVNKKAKKCSVTLQVDDNDLDTNLEIYYTNWMKGEGDEDFTLSLILEFKKEDFVSKDNKEA